MIQLSGVNFIEYYDYDDNYDDDDDDDNDDDEDDDDDDDDDDDNYYYYCHHFLLRVDFFKNVICYWCRFMVLLITRVMLHITFILHSFLLTPRISFLVIGSNFGSAEVRKVSYRISHVHFMDIILNPFITAQTCHIHFVTKSFVNSTLNGGVLQLGPQYIIP